MGKQVVHPTIQFEDLRKKRRWIRSFPNGVIIKISPYGRNDKGYAGMTIGGGNDRYSEKWMEWT